MTATEPFPTLVNRKGEPLLLLVGSEIQTVGGEVLAEVKGDALVRVNAVIGRFSEGRVRGPTGRKLLTVEGDLIVDWVGQTIAKVEGGDGNAKAALGLAFLEFIAKEAEPSSGP